jgi:hypothetical protein
VPRRQRNVPSNKGACCGDCFAAVISLFCPVGFSHWNIGATCSLSYRTPEVGPHDWSTAVATRALSTCRCNKPPPPSVRCGCCMHQESSLPTGDDADSAHRVPNNPRPKAARRPPPPTRTAHSPRGRSAAPPRSSPRISRPITIHDKHGGPSLVWAGAQRSVQST